MKKLILLSLAVASSLYAGGYKIPETSVNGVALCAANVAHSQNADAAYYNPANMSFMADENALEVDLMIVNLAPINFKGSGAQAGDDIDTESEIFLIPSLNYVSPRYGDFRYGLSVAVPGGLSKRWSESPAVDKAEEFTLEAVEVNPTVAYAINDKVSVAAGVRIVYSSGIVKSTGTISRDMEGDSFDYGYNLALSYKPAPNLDLALTYRSNIDLTEEGTAKLGDASGDIVYEGGATVTVPLPALFNLAVAYTFESKTTVEFVYERNFWSTYDVLDFGYADDIGNLKPYFDDSIAKEWKDTNVFRLGVTQVMDTYTLMAGIVIDETPVPDKTVSYELPDSDSVSVSFGGRYDINKEWNLGASVLYSMRDKRTVNNDDIEGEFSNANVLIVSAGVGYKF